MPASKTLISYIVRYGGRCRDCADTTIGPICDGTGLPCGDGERAIQHVLASLAYGMKNGFIAREDEPDLLSTARAEARREALEEALQAVRALGHPVGAGDGETRVIGTSADAEIVIRSLIETEDGK